MKCTITRASAEARPDTGRKRRWKCWKSPKPGDSHIPTARLLRSWIAQHHRNPGQNCQPCPRSKVSTMLPAVQSGTKSSPGGTAHWLRHRVGGARFSTIFLRVTFAHEIANSRVSGGQRLFVGQENDAEVLRPGTLAETGAVHHRHMLLANEFSDEDVVAFRDLDARVRVESPARRHTPYPRSFGTPFRGQIAAAAQFAFHFEKVILRAFERVLDGRLLVL